ncbi:MAG TPA: hypothetical protein VMV49_02985 [Candidatus Deferrimicrobium sp.]|nr:hypothetical protein [Candidatus Deferrimicrobium sp.]
MGKKIPKQAEELGITKQRLTILYARAKKIRMTFTKYVPDTADAIRDYITLQDPTMIQDRTGGGRNNTWYYLAPQAQIYVEYFDKAAGFQIVNPSNHAVQINIFTDNLEHVRGIANAVNNCWEDGILAHMEWKKIEGKYKIKADDCIAAWKQWL